MSLTYPGSLHNHTDYSNTTIRDSINTYKLLMDYAIELGHEVVAITEHECVSNAVKAEMYYKEIKEKHPDFKLILGNEIYLCRNGLNKENFVKGRDRYYHFILLAKDAIGHEQIRELSTRAWLRSYVTGKMVRRPTYYSDLRDIIEPNKGHVIACSACLGGFVASNLVKYYRDENEQIYDIVKDWCVKIENIFGKGNFFLEMQPSPFEEQKLANNGILRLSKELDIPYIVTTDSHYLKKDEASIHEAYLKSQEGEREVASFYATTYMMSTEELESYFEGEDWKDILQVAYRNIHTIKEMCEDFTLLKPLVIPELNWTVPDVSNQIVEKYCKVIPNAQSFIDSSYHGDNVLIKKIIEKVEAYPPLQNEETYREIGNNLEAIQISSERNKAHWSAYLLNLQDNIDVCWSLNTLVGPGRGSCVGFLICYLLGITQINPMWEKTRTYQWRFLNPERVSVLDIDVDIEGHRREEVLEGLKKHYGEDRVANVATFGTEKSKSAILTAARGLGIDVDEASYIASLVPSDRGIDRTLSQCYYGDEENDMKPISAFRKAMKDYPDLWMVAQRIEGLVCRIGVHAGGVIFVNEPFTRSTALMKTTDGQIITQFDLHDCERVSLIKIDMLSIKALDKIHKCINLLVEDGLIEPRATLRETYEEVIGVYNLERTAPEMWQMIWDHKIESLFQMEQQSGIQGIALTKPESVDDLATLNSVIRLMAQEKGGEQPLHKYARFKKNINAWYAEMTKYGLTEHEQDILKDVLSTSYGICATQELFMSLVQLPECGGFSLNWADRLRKSIAKKNPKEYLELQKEYYAAIDDKGLSSKLCHYVWDVLVATSRGYGFNASHTLAYSMVGLQEMNLCYKYPIIYWNCACVIIDSGDGSTPQYNKIAQAIGKMRANGIEILPPDINKSMYTFTVDRENNQIFYGLKGIKSVGDKVVDQIIQNRPYRTFKEFLAKNNITKTAMIPLIKSGAFDSLEERKRIMAYYIYIKSDLKKELNLRNLAFLVKNNMIPSDYNDSIKVYEFNNYLRKNCKKPGNSYSYELDEAALHYLSNAYPDLYSEVYEDSRLDMKIWDKCYYQIEMDVLREWIKDNKEELLEKINNDTLVEQWNTYCKGNYSSWEMESISYYYHEHELLNMNDGKYGIMDFFKLPEVPVVDRSFEKGGKVINMYKLTKIAGTCIAKDKAHGLVYLLTKSGVVTIRLNKEHFSMFDKQISEKRKDGTKKVIEKSWFNRGNMLLVQGYRNGNNFVAKKYKSTGGHQLYKICELLPNGDITVVSERYKGEAEEDEEE